MATFGPSALNCGPVHLTGKTLCSAHLQTSVPSMVSASDDRGAALHARAAIRDPAGHLGAVGVERSGELDVRVLHGAGQLMDETVIAPFLT